MRERREREVRDGGRGRESDRGKREGDRGESEEREGEGVRRERGDRGGERERERGWKIDKIKRGLRKSKENGVCKWKRELFSYKK